MTTDPSAPDPSAPDLSAELDTRFSDRIQRATQRREQDRQVRGQMSQHRRAGKAARHEQRTAAAELVDDLVCYSLRRACAGLSIVDLVDDVHEPPDVIRAALTRLLAAGRVEHLGRAWRPAATRPTTDQPDATRRRRDHHHEGATAA